jgi:hypothetical protein
VSDRLNPIAEKTCITEITLSDGTVITVHSGFDDTDEVTVAMYSAADLVVNDESDEPVAPVVELWMSAEAADKFAEAVGVGAALAFTARRPRLKVLAGGGVEG